jgi:hypothetical protein
MVSTSAPTCPFSSSGETTREKLGNSVLSLLQTKGAKTIESEVFQYFSMVVESERVGVMLLTI